MSFLERPEIIGVSILVYLEVLVLVSEQVFLYCLTV